MSAGPARFLLTSTALLAAMTLPARADGRAELVTCQAMVELAAQERAAVNPQNDAVLQRCRQIIRDWTLRESRMSVDEQGRPLR